MAGPGTALAAREARTGRPSEDHRRILNGILWVLRTGAPWPDLPGRYGPVGTVSSRFYRWRASGVWERVLSALQAEEDARGEVDWDLHFVDASVIRAHQHAAGARRDGAVGGEAQAREGGAGPQPAAAARGRRQGLQQPAARRHLRRRHSGR